MEFSQGHKRLVFQTLVTSEIYIGVAESKSSQRRKARRKAPPNASLVLEEFAFKQLVLMKILCFSGQTCLIAATSYHLS